MLAPKLWCLIVQCLRKCAQGHIIWKSCSGAGEIAGDVGSEGGALMANGPLRQLFWRVANALDYLLTLLRVRILDVLPGPKPETPAD